MRINEIAPRREKQVKALKKKFDDKGDPNCMGPNTTNTANQQKRTLILSQNVMKLKQY